LGEARERGTTTIGFGDDEVAAPSLIKETAVRSWLTFAMVNVNDHVLAAKDVSLLVRAII
jgi:hypothetical protein